MSEPSMIVRSFLDAVEARNVDAVLTHFASDAIWQNVPHPPAVGHDAIGALLRGIIDRSSKVQWDVVSEAYSAERAWLERIDRFWINGTEYAVECNGVLDFDTEAGVITRLRDYVDLGEWRARIAAADL